MAEAADNPRSTPSPARRRLRRTGALLAGAPLLAGLLLPAATAAQAAPEAPKEAGDAGTVAVSVDALTPNAPGDGDTLTVSGTVTNNGKQAVTDAHVDLRVGAALTTRSAIADVAKRSDAVSGATGDPVGGAYTAKFAKLTPGVAQPFTISVPVDKLDLGGDGVYPLGVTLSGETASQSWDQVLGARRTFLPWQPDAPDASTKTTVLWPLVSTVHVTAETGSNQQQTPVFRNDDLAAEIAPGGRLEQLVALGKALDVTWVIDPDLLASVDAMSGGYRVQADDDTTVAGTHQAQAKQFLAELQGAVSGKEVVALPFADPDLAALAHNGTNVTGSLSQLKAATDVAATTVETVLHVTPSTDFAWPVNGAVDPSIVKVATSAGADKVIARSDSLAETDGLSYTPSAARPIGGGTTAVVADYRLSTAFQGDLTNASSATLAVQNFLAQSLALTLQNDKQRSVVVAPQRMPTAAQAQALAKAVTALRGSTWSQPQGLAATSAVKPDPGATTTVPGRSAYPSALRKQELSKGAFQDIANTQGKLDNFKVILTDESRVVTPFGRAINREMSTSWRSRGSAASAYRQGVANHLKTLTDQVRLIDKSETKLSGRSATIPVTVQNSLVQGVDHLVLRLTSMNPTRLEIAGHDWDEQAVTVSGGHSTSVKFTTSANANGKATVVAQLFTQDGQPYGEEVVFDVRVTEITATVMLVIGGGFLLLVLAGFRMYTQRKRAVARAAEKAAEETAEADTAAEAAETAEESPARSGADDPQQASDGTPDTAAESTDPSGTGERVDR
ncbi:hypothetical protein IAG44_20785 [Streptomyces roseirectus]|uniref:Uncharacterized protein n=1 Tax=Streptomyces roseirectus TaxID=2768066 RepID=A0A7H0IFQ8_9ACTN|nr:DUF6049 family protein [Streptomyces roseirectus]QNP71624.1 hypothetical protein IAG44_20785 [Streptomyces roseirectus]